MKNFFTQWYLFSIYFLLVSICSTDLDLCDSLRVDETRRPTAQELLAHSWIFSMTQQNVHMDKWLREVWGN